MYIMNYRNPLERIKRSYDLFSFMIELYKFLDSLVLADLHKAYNRYLNNDDKEELSKIDELVDLLQISFVFGFESWKQSWLNMAETTEMSLPVYCLCSLVKIDNIIKALVLDNGKHFVNEGPLCTDNKYFLFLNKSNDFLFSKMLKTQKIFPGRTTVTYLNDSLNRYFNDFVILDQSYLNTFQPEVYYYSGMEINNKNLRIAIVPFSKTPWFRANIDKKSSTFSISYSDYHINIINQTYHKYIMEAEENSANIIIFPELAMNSKTEETIMGFFRDVPKSFTNLRLCFCGSVWDKRNNTSVLMSSAGTVLARQKKKVPYYPYIQDGVYYREDIISDKKVILIDIKSFGRIAYCICADINAKEIEDIINIMNVDFVFVSSYTKSTETMINGAKGKAELSAAATILCNARAAMDPNNPDKHSLGFCVIPKAQNKKLSYNIASHLIENGKNKNINIFFVDLHFDSCK